jgi:hypothetical protein
MSTQKELTFEIWRSSEKRCYYLMSAAGTGIGYSLATIAPAQTTIETRFLLCALVCWAISFIIGLKFLSGLQKAMAISKTIATNQQELSRMGADFQKQISNFIGQQTTTLGSWQTTFQYLQLLLLISGAFLLIWTKVDILEAIGWNE